MEQQQHISNGGSEIGKGANHPPLLKMFIKMRSVLGEYGPNNLIQTSIFSLKTCNRKRLFSISTKPISYLFEKRIIVYGYCTNILTFLITNFVVWYIVDWLIRTYYGKLGVRVTLSALIEYWKCLAVCYLIAMSDRETYAKEKTG